MINLIELRNYRDWTICESIDKRCKEGFPIISYKFAHGCSYGLISDFGCGSWALSSCIGGRGQYNDVGSIIIDHTNVNADFLRAHSAFIAEQDFPELELHSNINTPRDYISSAIDLGGFNYTLDDIKMTFHLTDNRFDRPLNEASGEIWNISVAIHYALEKDIFCFPWLNALDFSRYQAMVELGIIDFLKRKDKIILIPTSQKRLAKKYCDSIIQVGCI